jgi:hypothetical protein
MSRAEKKISRWLENPPTDAPKDEVIAVVQRFFAGRFEFKAGSHIVVRDERLRGYPNYGPDGDFTIPVRGGQKVKGVYLKRLAETISLLEEIE